MAQAPTITVSRDSREGPFSAWPAALTLTEESHLLIEGNGQTLRDILIKAPQDQPNGLTMPSLPGGTGSGGNPDYTVAALLHSVTANTIALTPQLSIINAISTNVMWMPTPTLDGRLIMSEDRWVAIAASVKRGHGRVDSHFQTAANGFQSGAVIASYIFEGSTNISSHLVGRTHFEMTGVDMGFDEDVDVNSFDFHIGMIAANPGLSPHAPFVGPQRDVYFSVSREWVTWLETNNIDLDFTPNPNPTGPHDQFLGPDSAVVYKVTPTTSGGWSNPTVYRDRGALGLSNDPTEDVDALVVSDSFNVVIYSTQPHEQRSQLLVKHPSMPTAEPLKDKGGVTMTERLRLTEDDDIDAACGEDPESPTIGYTIGTPQESTSENDPWYADPMGVSVARSITQIQGLPFYKYDVDFTGRGNLAPNTVGSIAILWHFQEVTPGPISTLIGVPNVQVVGGVNMPAQSNVAKYEMLLPPIPGLNIRLAWEAFMVGPTGTEAGGSPKCYVDLKIP